MLRIFSLSLFLVNICLVTGQSVRASAIEGHSCTVTAAVAKTDLDSVLITISTAEKSLRNGNCNFIKKGEVYKARDKNLARLLKPGDIIKSGVESASSMGPFGVVGFLLWKPVTVFNQEQLTTTEFQTSAQPEK